MEPESRYVDATVEYNADNPLLLPWAKLTGGKLTKPVMCFAINPNYLIGSHAELNRIL
jgi:hypothetical protein